MKTIKTAEWVQTERLTADHIRELRSYLKVHLDNLGEIIDGPIFASGTGNHDEWINLVQLKSFLGIRIMGLLDEFQPVIQNAPWE